ncbi:MAG: c-type cytochrome [Acetobacteraceae bacterium]
MDSLKVNMVIASILVAGLAFMITKFIAEAVISPGELAKPAFMVAETAAPATAAAKPAGVPSITPLLAKANVKKGEQFVADVCAACHNYTKGGGAKIGPDLYDVVDRPRHSVKGFDYSDAIKKLGGNWTYHNLNLWLHDPQAIAPGTRMTYTGIKDTQTRADVIAFLRTLSPNPVPLPKVAPAKPASAAPAAAKPASAKGEATSSAPSSTTPPAASSSAAPAAAVAAAKPALPPSFAALIDKADVKKGKEFVSGVCAACHNDTPGAGAKIGPDLYSVVGRARASVKGFDYSSAIKKLGGTWTYANLDDWLTDPAKVAPGTRMTFPGIPQAPLRADVIAYLRTLSQHPEPLPAAPGSKP